MRKPGRAVLVEQAKTFRVVHLQHYRINRLNQVMCETGLFTAFPVSGLPVSRHGDEQHLIRLLTDASRNFRAIDARQSFVALVADAVRGGTDGSLSGESLGEQSTAAAGRLVERTLPSVRLVRCWRTLSANSVVRASSWLSHL
jgi:hypothetical protein